MKIWTDDALSEIWSHLRYLQSPYNIKNLLLGKIRSNREDTWHESDDLDKRCFEISSCIKQADEYFKSSEISSLATKPLLQYYGSLCLAKSVILFKDKSIFLSDLNYHGLSTRSKTTSSKTDITELIDYNDNSDKWIVEKEYAIVNDGVFPILCKCIEDNVPENGKVIRFKELIKIFPDMIEKYNRYYGESSNCFGLYGDGIYFENNRIKILFQKHEDINLIRKIFPEFNEGYDIISELTNGFISSNEIDNIPLYFAIEKATISGSKYLIRPLDCGIHKSFSILFVSLFILSILVRYKTYFWMGVLEGRNSGEAPLIESLCNTVKRRLPNDALEAIWNEEFVYMTPGYLI